MTDNSETPEGNRPEYSVSELSSALKRTVELDRKRVREAFNQRFTARRMARDYLSAYMALTEVDLPPIKVA